MSSESTNNGLRDWFHLIDDPMANAELLRLCDKNTPMGDVIRLVESLFVGVLLRNAVRRLLPRFVMRVVTPMCASVGDDSATLSSRIINPDTQVVIANILRAGNVPSMACHRVLAGMVRSRVDHFGAGRVTDEYGVVVGTGVTYKKLGEVDGCFLFVPDPMGATGGTDVRVLDEYDDIALSSGVALLHLIVTPEYLRRIREFVAKHPWTQGKVHVFALRLDRGLSSIDDMESSDPTVGRGLTEHGYIVPGAGDLGERLTGVP
jgi:uracil phosphoribosyltransferase